MIEKKSYYQFAIALALTALVCSACGQFSGDKGRAEKVVETYHRLYNEQNYEEIYNTAHEEAKANKSKEGLGLVLAEAFEKFGKHISSELVYTKVSVINSKERQVEFACQSKFENGLRNETFLIVTNDEKGFLHSIGELSDVELKKLK